MNELSFYAQRIEEAEKKADRIANKLALATDTVTRSMLSYELYVADEAVATWDEMAKEHLCYIV